MGLAPSGLSHLLDASAEESQVATTFMAAIRNIYTGSSKSQSDGGSDQIDEAALDLIPNCMAKNLHQSPNELVAARTNSAAAGTDLRRAGLRVPAAELCPRLISPA